VRSKILRSAVICLCISSLAMPVFANDTNPLRKLVRGFVNLGLCMAELGRQPMHTAKEEGDLAGATWGLAKGFAFTVGRAVLGAYEVSTFILPPYRPLVEPEFIFSDEEDN
jgi:putative exosortase-associated protein (TIGR04073 family)